MPPQPIFSKKKFLYFQFSILPWWKDLSVKQQVQKYYAAHQAEEAADRKVMEHLISESVNVDSTKAKPEEFEKKLRSHISYLLKQIVAQDPKLDKAQTKSLGECVNLVRDNHIAKEDFCKVYGSGCDELVKSPRYNPYKDDDGSN